MLLELVSEFDYDNPFPFRILHCMIGYCHRCRSSPSESITVKVFQVSTRVIIDRPTPATRNGLGNVISGYRHDIFFLKSQHK